MKITIEKTVNEQAELWTYNQGHTKSLTTPAELAAFVLGLTNEESTEYEAAGGPTGTKATMRMALEELARLRAARDKTGGRNEACAKVGCWRVEYETIRSERDAARAIVAEARGALPDAGMRDDTDIVPIIRELIAKVGRMHVERDTARAERDHSDSILDDIHDVLWTAKNRVKGDDRRGMIAAIEALKADRESLKSGVPWLREALERVEKERDEARRLAQVTAKESEAAYAALEDIDEVLSPFRRPFEHALPCLRRVVRERTVTPELDSLRRVVATLEGSCAWNNECCRHRREFPGSDATPPAEQSGKERVCEALYSDGTRCAKAHGHDGWHKNSAGIETAQWDGPKSVSMPIESGPLPGEHSSADYSATAIAWARACGKMRVTPDGLGWIRDMTPDQPRLSGKERAREAVESGEQAPGTPRLPLTLTSDDRKRALQLVDLTTGGIKLDVTIIENAFPVRVAIPLDAAAVYALQAWLEARPKV